jgi:hypothetical protein
MHASPPRAQQQAKQGCGKGCDTAATQKRKLLPSFTIRFLWSVLTPNLMSTSAIPLQPLGAAPTGMQPAHRPPSPPSPSPHQTVAPPLAGTVPLAGTTPPATPTQAAPLATAAVYGPAGTATPMRPPREWQLVKFVRQNLVAIVTIVGFATAIYYGSRSDSTGSTGMYYTTKTWDLSAWTAEIDYCEFKRTYKVDKAARTVTEMYLLIICSQNDTECDPGPPPVIRAKYTNGTEYTNTTEYTKRTAYANLRTSRMPDTPVTSRLKITCHFYSISITHITLSVFARYAVIPSRISRKPGIAGFVIRFVGMLGGWVLITYLLVSLPLSAALYQLQHRKAYFKLFNPLADIRSVRRFVRKCEFLNTGEFSAAALLIAVGLCCQWTIRPPIRIQPAPSETPAPRSNVHLLSYEMLIL